MHPLDLRATELARTQHGAFHARQILGHGTRRQIRTRVATGRWNGLGADVYALPSHPPDLHHLCKAAELSHREATVSGMAAAALHNLMELGATRPEISVPAGSTHENPLATVRRRTDLRSQRIEGIRVTTVAQTIADLMGRSSLGEIERMIDTSVIGRRTSVEALDERARAMDRHHLPHRALFRAILDERTRATTLAESLLEVRLHELLRTIVGLPPLARQHALDWWANGAGRADVAVPAWRVLIEVDGRTWHARLDDFERDRRRDQLAAMHGWLVLRFTWLQVTKAPHEVVEAIVGTGPHREAA